MKTLSPTEARRGNRRDVFLKQDFREQAHMSRCHQHGSLRPALPTLWHVWRVIQDPVLAASAAGERSELISETGFASRGSAPCCARKRRQVLEVRVYVGAIRVH